MQEGIIIWLALARSDGCTESTDHHTSPPAVVTVRGRTCIPTTLEGPGPCRSISKLGSAVSHSVRDQKWFQKETCPETGLVEIFQRHSGSTRNDDDWDKGKWLQEAHFLDR